MKKMNMFWVGGTGYNVDQLVTLSVARDIDQGQEIPVVIAEFIEGVTGTFRDKDAERFLSFFDIPHGSWNLLAPR